MRILLVDDDEILVQSLKASLESDGYTVDTAFDGEKGSFMARTNDYDIVLLDGMMPRRPGLRVCTEIRASGKMVPILMLSVQTAVPAKVAVLDHGADDYLPKPFSYDELRARIKALLRRPKVILSTILKFQDLTVDCGKQKATRGNKDVYLTKKEFALLEYLMRQRPRVVSRGMIMEHVWNSETDPFSNTIESHILNIRKKLETGRNKRLIFNVPGRGYKIDKDR